MSRRFAFIDKRSFASGLLERSQLYVRALVIGRDAGVSVFHKKRFWFGEECEIEL